MKKFSKLCLAALPMLHAYAANNDPIVLVHGFSGWGRDEMLGYKHWGGFYDIQEELKAKGHMTYTAAVGPFSSNWDRAAELYAQMTGTCTDYGAAHAARFGITRFGRCYEKDVSKNPAYVGTWDAAHKVHFVAHSQGAQTTRMLVQLLEEGSQEERAATGAATSPLFQGGKNGWVRSVSTISGANNGTSLALIVPTLLPDVVAIVGGVAAAAGLDTNDKKLYDFKLDQFGLQRQDGESLTAYAKRVNDSPVFKGSKNTALYDLDPDGAKELNGWVKTSPNVYYYSIANHATEQGSFCCNETDRLIAPIQSSAYQYARYDMIFFLKNTAGEWVVPSILQEGMGSYRAPEWYANDGVVNTSSMRGPDGQPIRLYDGTPARGSWNYIGYYDQYDHFDVIGWDSAPWEVYPVYDNLLSILSKL